MDDSPLPKPSSKFTLGSSYKPAPGIIPIPLPKDHGQISVNCRQQVAGKPKYVVYLQSCSQTAVHEDQTGKTQNKRNVLPEKSKSQFSRNIKSTKRILPQNLVQQTPQYLIVPASTNLQKLQARLLLPSTSVSIPKQKSAPDLRVFDQSHLLSSPTVASSERDSTPETGVKHLSKNTVESSFMNSNEITVYQGDIEQLSSRGNVGLRRVVQTSDFSRAEIPISHVEEVFSGPYLQSLMESDNNIYQTAATEENESSEIYQVGNEAAATHPYLVQNSIIPSTACHSLVFNDFNSNSRNNTKADAAQRDGNYSGMSTAGQLDADNNKESVVLQFDDHHFVLLNKLNEFRKREEFCDLTILIGETKFVCHSVVASSISPVFYTLLQPQSLHQRNFVMKLDSRLDTTSFSNLLNAMYTGQINLDENTAGHILVIASYLEISSMENKCENYYKSLHNVSDLEDVSLLLASLSKPVLCNNSTDASEPEISRGASQVQSAVFNQVESITDNGPSSESDSILVVDECSVNATSSNSSNIGVSQDVAKPRSSLTNLVRVASEAFKDLDQEENTVEMSSDDVVLSSEEAQDVDLKELNNETEDLAVSTQNETWCKLCKKQFTSTARYRNHLKTIHSAKKIHKCNYCDKCFGKISDRLLHEKRIHTKEKPHQCEICKKKFCLQRELKRHLKCHKENNLVCTICGKKFTSEAGMKHHVSAHGDKKYKCRDEDCEAMFATIQLRKRHEKNHTTEKPFRCEKCKAAFKSNHELTRHKLIHTGEKVFSCDKCSRSFGRAEHLKNHMLTHDENRHFKCNKCDKTFKQKAGLNAHEKKHTAPFNYVCDVCGYKCHSKAYLQLHSVTHTDNRPFKCEICSTTFKAKKHLNRHTKIHIRKGETDVEKYKKMNDTKLLKQSFDRKKIKKNNKVIYPEIAPTTSGKNTNNKGLPEKPINIFPRSHSIEANFYTGGSLKLYALNNQQTVTVLPSLQEAFCSGSNTVQSHTLQVQQDQSTVQVNEDLLQFSNSVMLGAGAQNVHIDNSKTNNNNGTNTPDWQCSAQEIADTTTSMHLSDENYIPVLTAEDFL